MLSRPERDRIIVESYLAGQTRTDIGARFGISPRRVSQIVAAHGATRIGGEQCAVIRATGRRIGRPGLPLRGEDWPDYRKIRRYLGAGVARAHFGIGP